MKPHVSGIGALDIYHQLFLQIVKTILTLYI